MVHKAGTMSRYFAQILICMQIQQHEKQMHISGDLLYNIKYNTARVWWHIRFVLLVSVTIKFCPSM